MRPDTTGHEPDIGGRPLDTGHWGPQEQCCPSALPDTPGHEPDIAAWTAIDQGTPTGRQPAARLCARRLATYAGFQSEPATRRLSAAALAALSPRNVSADELALILAEDVALGRVKIIEGAYRLAPWFERLYGRALREIGSAP